MGKFLGKIFGSDSIINAGIKGIDALVFTDEEKAKMHMNFLKLYEPFKLAQRYLAFGFGGAYLLVFFNAVLVWNIGVFTADLEMQGFYMATAHELANWNNETLGTPVSIILGFYFMGGVLNIRAKDK